MKAIFISVLIFYSSISFSEVIELKIEDVANKISKENFMVLENAERVYQRKENIKFSRAGLLPKLNIWNLLKIPAIIVDPLAIGDIIQDIAPFLVPANWFKAGQSKHLYKSQKEQYRALWANEVSTGKLLFMSVYRDMMLQKLVANKSKQYKEILNVAESPRCLSCVGDYVMAEKSRPGIQNEFEKRIIFKRRGEVREERGRVGIRRRSGPE